MIERTVIASLAVQESDRHRGEDVDVSEGEDAFGDGSLRDGDGKRGDRRELDEKTLERPLRCRIDLTQKTTALADLGRHHRSPRSHADRPSDSAQAVTTSLRSRAVSIRRPAS